MSSELFDLDPEDTEEALMAATYRALVDRGYADLTIDAIGEEFEKSKSLLYHHYDGKDDLLVSFLAYVLDRFEAETAIEGPPEDPDARLRSFLDRVLPTDPGEDRLEFRRAMLELRGQAPRDPAYREQFARSDRVLGDRIATLLTEGVEQGVYREVDPERTAEFLVATLHGAMNRRAMVEDGRPAKTVREEIGAYLDTHVRRPGEVPS